MYRGTRSASAGGRIANERAVDRRRRQRSNVRAVLQGLAPQASGRYMDGTWTVRTEDVQYSAVAWVESRTEHHRHLASCSPPPHPLSPLLLTCNHRQHYVSGRPSNILRCAHLLATAHALLHPNACQRPQPLVHPASSSGKFLWLGRCSHMTGMTNRI